MFQIPLWPRGRNNFSDATRTHGSVIRAPFTRIEREVDGGGWLVLASNGHGWLFGDRPRALRAKRWHDQQWGRA
jgi:hypothetical protein